MHFIDTNPACERLLGYSREELLTMSTVQIDVDLDIVKPEHQKLNHGDPLINFEHQVRRKDGKIITLLNNSVALKNDQGEVTNWYSFLVDITDMRKTEQAYRDEQALTKRILQSSVDGMIAIDIYGCIKQFNRAAEQILGYKRQEAIGQNISMFIFEQAQPRHESFIYRYLDGCKSKNIIHHELHAMRKGGSWFDLEISIAEFKYSSQQYFLCTIRDISERKRIEQELHKTNIKLNRVNRMKSEFLANMSHELRTPLNAIIGFSAVMLDGLTGTMNTEQLEYTEDIHTSGEHLLELINDILDLSKIDEGKMKLNRSEVRLKDLAEGCLTIIREIAANQGISLSLEIELAPDTTALIDEQKCKQMIINLLSNAIKFSNRDGAVTLGIRKVHRESLPGMVKSDAKQWLAISVMDQGIGIRDADLKYLFQPFLQLENPLTKSYKGTGLGLALTQQLAELHGGSVHVSSTFGKGSCFSIFLPCQLSNALPNKQPNRNKLLDMNAGKNNDKQTGKTVLVIDDDPRATKLVASYMTESTYQILSSTSGQDGLNMAEHHLPDLILLDLMIPDMSGFEIIDRLKSNLSTSAIPVIIMTSKQLSSKEIAYLDRFSEHIISKGNLHTGAFISMVDQFIKTVDGKA